MAFDNLTDEELLESYRRDVEASTKEPEQTTDFSQMSDEELLRSYQNDLAQQGEGEQPSDGEEYGFTQRRQDEITARTGREASAGQVYAEGTLPFVRGVREGMENDEDRSLYSFVDNSAISDARSRGLARMDYTMRGYKAKPADKDDTSAKSAVASNLPFVGALAGAAVDAARESNDTHITDALENVARKARISEDEIEKAREYSQGDAEKMNEYFANIARERFGERAAKKGEAQGRLAAAGEEGFMGKVGGGVLGMLPMIEEFAVTGAAGKALGIGGKIAKGATSAWRANVVNGLKHSSWMTPVMGTEMATRRYKELTAPEYYEDPETHELVMRKGDDSGSALAKAAAGGYSEAAIFSLPIGEALFGKAAPAVTKLLRTKVGNTAANMYTKYVQYGRLTGLRGQPQMLALMDLNTFKDQVLGFGKKDADYEGFSKEWDKFVNGEELPDGTHAPGVLSLEGQADIFISTLGMITLQGAGAFVGARRAMTKERRSTDSVLSTYWHVPKENLDRMAPEQKAVWRQVIDRLGRAETKEQRLKVEENLKKFCERLDEKFGKEANFMWENMGKFALQFDNSVKWENNGDTSGYQSKFSVPAKYTEETDKDGKKFQRRVVPWEKTTVHLPDGREVEREYFTDPNTGISVVRWLPTDRAESDEGYVYLVTDSQGRRAVRRGMRDAFDAASEMSRQMEKNVADRGAKKDALNAIYQEYAKGESPLTVDTAEQAAFILGRELGDGEIAFTDGDGQQVYVLDKIQTPEQMRKTVLHEVGRHRGLDMVFGAPEQKQQFLELLSKSNDPVVRNQVETIMAARGYGSEKELLKDPNAMEEVFAHLFDHEGVPDEPGWWDAHMTAMRKGLRRVFHSLPMSRTEAEEVYRGAMDRLAEQTGGEIQYIPEATEREMMVEEQRRREENQIAGREAERDIAEIRDGGERRRAENEALGDEVQGQADAVRNAQGAEAVRGAMAAEGLRMGMGRERAERERRAEESRVEKEREVGRKRQDELAAQKAEVEAYDEQERQRIERERKEEQDAQDEAELQRMYDEDARARAAARKGEATEGGKQPPPRRESLADEADRLAENPPRIPEDDRIDRIAKAKERAKQNEIADRNARLKKAGEEYDRAEEERKRREAEEALLPKITTVEPEPQGKGRTAPQNDVLRVNYGAEEGRDGHQLVARRVTDDNGKVIGWDVSAVAKDGTETYIASTTKPKKDGMSAIRAVRRQIHDHFGIPYGREAREAMDAERRRLEEAEARRTKDEAWNGADEAPAKPEQGIAGEPEAREAARPVEAEPPRAEAPREGVVVHHANEGREGDGVRAAEDALAGLFGDEGADSRADGAEGAEGGSRRSGGGSADDAMSFLRNLPPDFKFFDERDELMDDNRRDGNQQLVNLIGKLYDEKKIRGFGGFAKIVKDANPALWAEQKDRLRGLWNYAAEISDGKIARVGDYEARDAIRSADEGRNVRDVSGVNALQAALQDIDPEMYPAAKLDSSDARVPNMKREADPKTGIIPGNELKGRPRSLLSKPILGVEFEDGTVAVGTGRHRKDLYERFGMDIPMRRVREADGWVTKKPDGTYDFTKIRLLDALDNIQDGKGSIEDYVAFFRDVQIPRGEAESEGFIGSKEARLAYAIANDAHPDIRAAINFEGGKVDGMIKPEQAAAIAEIAPVSGGKENADLQHYLLKAVQKDSSLDRRDLDIKASEAMHMARVKQAQDGAEQMGFDFFGEEDVQNAAAKAEKYRAAQAAKFSRLAKNLRQAQRSNENDMAQIKIAREDMRELGINERKVAAGGKEKRDELQKAIDNALLQQMRWESVNLDPALRAQMEKDLGIAPKETAKNAAPDFALESVTQGQIDAEAKAQAQRDEIQRRLNAPLKGGVGEMGQQLMDLGGQEGGDLFNRVHFFDKNEEFGGKKGEEYRDWLRAANVADSAEQRRKYTEGRKTLTQDEMLYRAILPRQYTPAKYKVPGAVKSRTLLEEPPALRATEPPDNNYKLQIPEKHIKNGDLQEHQLEFVGYAGRAHGMKDANGSPLGMMGGYGTGAGKSRMIAGTILDNRWRGRNRALWITTQRGLIDDVRSECEPFGMGNLVEDIGDKPMPKNGIGFTTYSNLRNEGTVEQIAKELGKDFDGVVAFDEIHRAKTEGGRTQDAVVKLQELLPKARVIYMSATGATDVGNLGYATRLGLWGEGTPFKDFEDFKSKVEGKGVSAMEMVARTLKKRGQNLSANLSKEGVEFDHVAVPTTERQKKTYTEYNNALKDVYKGVYDALEVLGRLDYTVPPSSLHGMQQRLHYSMVTALKVPVLIERAKQELAKGNVPVFSLVNTNEAGATREVAKALEEGRQIGMDDVNFGPKQILLDFLTKEGDKRYKNRDQQLAYKDYQFPTMKPVKDGSGEVIGFERDQIADGIRRRLVNEVEKLPDEFGNPINMIIDAFGKDNVANLTGLNKGGMAEDYKAFQNGDKKVLVFSGVANTGYTFSSDRKYKNQARRVAFPLQLGFRADELEQTLGRVHRNNQANAPIYIASTTDLPGERRFYSSVERRRGQMKALTTGDRSASGNGITSEGDNFETKYAQQAVDGIIAMLHRMGKLDDVAREMNFIRRIQRPDGSVVEVNGMLKRDKSGAILPNVSAKRFLNRLLMLDPQKQDGMFTAFKNLLDQNIRWAQEDGEYDIGLQDIGSTHNDAVRSVKLADDMDVRHVNSWFKTDKVSFDDFAKAHAAEFVTYVRNKRTGETFAVRSDGKMGRKQEPAAMRYAVDGTKRRMRASILDTEKPNAAYEKLDAAKAKELWDAEYGVIPDERADDGFYADGDLLKHWSDVLGSKPPRTFRVKAGDAPEYIGTKIDTDEIPAIFGRFGKAEEARDMVIDGKVREVLNNRTVDLVNGWTLKQVPRDGAKKVMVRGVEPAELDAVAKELGGEVSKKRIFMEPDAAKLRKIIEEHPANLYRDDEKIGDTGNLRFFNREEEVSPDRERDAAYRDWLESYGMDDTEKHRAEWERKHPATKVAEGRISPAEDAAYMDAVERGDTEAAQRMVREAAARAMPDTTVVDADGSPMKVYHGSRTGANIKIFNTPSFFSDNRDIADMFKKEADFILRVNGKEVAIDDGTARQIADELTRGDYTPDEMADWGSFENLIGEIKDNGKSYGGRDVITDALAGAGIDTPLDEITEMSFKRVPDIYGCYVNIAKPLEIDFKGKTWGQEGTIEMEAAVRDAAKNGYDGVIVRNIREGGFLGELRDGKEPPLSTDYIPISPNQIKSADSVTRDDAGKVIPLSQRFNRENPDIRYFNIDEEAGRRVHAKDYDEARRMEGAGADRREIWEKTGWWKAKDGKWRYEIAGISAADTKKMLDFALASGKFYDKDKANVYSFSLNDLEAAMKAKGERLPDSVKTLLKAYPKLGREIIEVDRMAKQPEDGTLGYATKGKIHLYEQGTTAEALNHELQHRIQAASGMAGGTNTSNKSFDRYTHEHGEWEARQAATRAEMSPEERGKTAPWETADRHGVAEDATQIDDANRARIRADGEPEEPEPAAPAADRKTGVFEKAKTELVDRYDPLKQMEIATGRRGKKDLYTENSPYNAMRLLHGHNEAARQRYEKIWKRPFEDMLRKAGVTVDDVGQYMMAMNVKDRNRKVMERTGALDGAGLSDADADKMLTDMRNFLGAEKMGKVEKMADFLWQMQAEGMARRVESGRVAKEVAEQWEKEEPHHVPMRDDLSDETGDYNRSTRQWRKSDFATAEGRFTKADNPVEFMFREYQDAMYGSNINEARRALADFVRTTPGIGKIRKGVKRGKAWSFTHKQIEDFPDPNYREQTVKGGAGRPNLVSFKEGGTLYMIELNGKQGERVAEAVIGRGVQNMWKPVATFTRGYASTATELSPAFLGRNFAADMLEASINTMADKGIIKGGAAAAKNIINAVRMVGTIRKYIKTGKFEGKFADVMRRYVESGASIGGMGNEGYTEIKNDLGKVSEGKYGVMDVLKFVGRGISDINKQGELATRLAVFKDYIDGGASDGEAAMRSREYSTDFNKYGNQRWMNSAWMFSGSVIGGAVRQTASLVQGKAGKRLALGLFTYGIMEAVAEHFFNEDDDKKASKSGEPSGATMTEFQRANSLYFRIGDKFIRVPFHAGPFSVLKYAGNVAARAVLGDISGADAAKNIGKEALDSGMHFTGTGDFNSDTPVQSLLPTLLVPFYQLKGNEDYAGRPIRKQMFSETKPYSENGRKQTGDIWKSVAREMNALSGGNEKRRGWFDFSPENYKFVVDAALKNLGRDITTVSDFVTDMKEGKPVDSSHILFGRDYWRDVPDNTQNFYEAERRYKADSADGTIRRGSRRDEQIKTLLRDITTLRHWEDGEEKVGNRWVKRRNPSEATKEKHRKQRLKYQQKVIDLMNRRK